MDYNPALNLIFGFIYNRKKLVHNSQDRRKRCHVMQQLQVFLNQQVDLKKSIFDCCRIDLCTYLEQGVTVLKTNWKFDQKQSDDAEHLVRAI